MADSVNFSFDSRALERALRALPAELQASCYGDGLKFAGNAAARQSRRLCRVGKGPALRLSGLPRKRLRDSIYVRLVGWSWDGKRVPKSAVVITAQQPHAHLIERGTVKAPAYPFLSPPLQDSARLLKNFRLGAERSFRRVVKRIESGNVTKAIGRAISR